MISDLSRTRAEQARKLPPLPMELEVLLRLGGIEALWCLPGADHTQGKLSRSFQCPFLPSQDQIQCQFCAGTGVVRLVPLIDNAIQITGYTIKAGTSDWMLDADLRALELAKCNRNLA